MNCVKLCSYNVAYVFSHKILTSTSIRPSEHACSIFDTCFFNLRGLPCVQLKNIDKNDDDDDGVDGGVIEGASTSRSS